MSSTLILYAGYNPPNKIEEKKVAKAPVVEVEKEEIGYIHRDNSRNSLYMFMDANHEVSIQQGGKSLCLTLGQVSALKRILNTVATK